MEPPLGSFSFIEDRIITPNDDGITATVGTSEAWVRVGSNLENKKMNVQHLKVKEGTQVVILDKKPVYSDGGVWIKIQPPAADYPYIPSTAVRPAPSQMSPAPQPASSPPPLLKPK